MKTKHLFLALLASVALFVACEKEPVNPEPITLMHAVNYDLDGQLNHQSVSDLQAQQELYLSLLQQSRLGHHLILLPTSPAEQAAKSTITFDTNDIEVFYAWCMAMLADHRQVTIEYDDRTGNWHGEAVTCVAPAFSLEGAWKSCGYYHEYPHHDDGIVPWMHDTLVFYRNGSLYHNFPPEILMANTYSLLNDSVLILGNRAFYFYREDASITTIANWLHRDDCEDVRYMQFLRISNAQQ